MLWEVRPLRDIREIDVRRLLESGLEEHLQLEYKSALYEDNDRGRREFLLDLCMFANAFSGILLIGVPERRDEHGQPTGVPDRLGARTAIACNGVPNSASKPHSVKIVVKKARREWLCGPYRGGVGDLWINFNAGDGFGMPGRYAQRRASSAHMRSSRSCI